MPSVLFPLLFITTFHQAAPLKGAARVDEFVVLDINACSAAVRLVERGEVAP